MKRGTVIWDTKPAQGKGTNLVEITPERLKQLSQLCHPDRHDNSALSTAVFQWLREIGKPLV